LSAGHLKGKDSCHSGYKEDFAGWIAPVHAMKNVHLINSEKDIGEFFVRSCVPGADRDSSLCSLCIGNLASKDENLAEITKCSSTEAEDYKGGRGALKYVKLIAEILSPSLLIYLPVEKFARILCGLLTTCRVCESDFYQTIRLICAAAQQRQILFSQVHYLCKQRNASRFSNQFFSLNNSTIGRNQFNWRI
jgi:hypothetical protein